MSEPLEIPDPKLCGLGEGDRCCAFLTMGHTWLCARTMGDIENSIRARLAGGTMNAKYDPGPADEVPYPECQTRRIA